MNLASTAASACSWARLSKSVCAIDSINVCSAASCSHGSQSHDEGGALPSAEGKTRSHLRTLSASQDQNLARTILHAGQNLAFTVLHRMCHVRSACSCARLSKSVCAIDSINVCSAAS